MRDKLSIERIAKLHPKARHIFAAFIDECEAINPEYTFRVMQGLRTFDEQAALYRQGRGAAGKIVTNSNAGQSYHNYGLAIDLCELDGNAVDWAFNMGLLVAIANRYGISWGGNFKSITDRPHFEIRFGYTWQRLLELHKAGKVDADGYVLI